MSLNATVTKETDIGAIAQAAAAGEITSSDIYEHEHQGRGFQMDNPTSDESDPNSRIFDGSDRLEKIRAFARYRSVGPNALLLTVLARLASNIDPGIMVDIGKGPGSLNLFGAIVGPSGSEKSRTLSAGADALRISNPSADYEVRTPGSGEGIIGAYAPQLKFHGKGEDPTEVPGATSVLWQESEIMNLTALKSRKGATLQGFLTKLFTAEFLNVSNKDGGPTIEENSYRASLLLGVQPGRADALLADADQGFPQRFIWTDTLDRSREMGFAYSEVRPLDVRIPNYPSGVIEGCDTAKRITREAADRGLIYGDFNGLDSHANFARAKVAALIAVLREHEKMTEDDWQRAGYIMLASDKARRVCMDYKTESKRAAKEIEGREMDQSEREMVAEVQSKIMNCVNRDRNKDKWLNRSDISQDMPGQRWRGEVLDVALGRMVAAGKIQAREHPKFPEKTQYRL